MITDKTRLAALLFAVMLLGTFPAAADPWEDMVREKAGEIVTGRFSADWGAADYYAECTEHYGGEFIWWTIEQQNWVSQLLPYLIEAEDARLKKYHPDQVRSLPFEDAILRWRYGVREPDTVPEEDARQKALAFLKDTYGMDCSGDDVSVSLYTGCSGKEEFAAPCWVFRFYRDAVKRAEVWIDSRSGLMPAHRAADAADAGRKELCRAGDIFAGGQAVTPDMLTDEAVTAVWFEEKKEWHVFISLSDTRWEITIDDRTLETVDRNRIRRPADGR